MVGENQIKTAEDEAIEKLSIFIIFILLCRVFRFMGLMPVVIFSEHFYLLLVNIQRSMSVSNIFKTAQFQFNLHV